ncbi:MAG: SseB family protein [Rhodobacterales bacterium]|nr:SseB family protein [Rhodobacterales bacterium]
MTELDQAHAAMEAAPEDELARLRFHERLADGELFLLLDEEPVGDRVNPSTFEVEGQVFVLVFDREERLSAFVGTVAPVVSLSGRSLVAMLARQGIGMALNPEVAPSSMLIGAEAVDWLADVLAQGPVEAAARPVELTAPKGVPDALLTGLDRKLAGAAGLAQAAWLAGVTYADGRRGHMIAFVGAVPGAEQAMATAVAEALIFSGIEAGALDVTFLVAEDPVIGQLSRVGLRFDLPVLVVPQMPGQAPGTDPAKPPRLRRVFGGGSED